MGNIPHRISSQVIVKDLQDGGSLPSVWHSSVKYGFGGLCHMLSSHNGRVLLGFPGRVLEGKTSPPAYDPRSGLTLFDALQSRRKRRAITFHGLPPPHGAHLERTLRLAGTHITRGLMQALMNRRAGRVHG